MKKLTPNYMNPDLGVLTEALNELIGEVNELREHNEAQGEDIAALSKPAPEPKKPAVRKPPAKK